MDRLKGKVVIIAGECKGVGEITSVLFANEGAKVVIADSNTTIAQKTVKDIKKAGNEAVFFKVNVTKVDDCKEMVDFTIKTYGRIDVLFCNIEKKGDLEHDIAHMDQKNLREVLENNVIGTWNCIHHTAPFMVKNRKGSIICLASADATIGDGSAYGPSKAAVVAMVIGVANELGRYNIRCNSISPYTCLTKEESNIIKKTDAGRRYLKEREEFSPMYKLIEPNDVAYAALYLASEESGSTSAMDLWVDKGAVKASSVNRMPRRG